MLLACDNHHAFFLSSPGCIIIDLESHQFTVSLNRHWSDASINSMYSFIMIWSDRSSANRSLLTLSLVYVENGH